MDNKTLTETAKLTTKGLRLLRALNNPERQQILRYLHQNPAADVSTLYKAMNILKSQCSQQLTILRRSGFLSATRDGKRILHTVNAKRLREVQAIVSQLS